MISAWLPVISISDSMHSLDTYQLAIIALGAIAFGIVLLVKGGDWTVDSAVAIARNHGISKVFIAATVIAFGTSAPELFTSINANISGFPGLSVGNVIGSNIANVLLVIGAAAIIAPIIINRRAVRVDTIVMLAATGAMVPAILYGLLPRWGGGLMVAGIIGYILYQYKASKLDVEEIDDIELGRDPRLMIVVGIMTLLIGSEILVRGAVAGGIALGVPEAVIGMTLIAFGTSLPELTACIAAARKGESDVIIGGIIGSNIFNILSVMALSAVVRPLIIEPHFAGVDLFVVLSVTLVFAALLFTRTQIGRVAGIALGAAYAGFIVLQYGVT